MTPGRALGATAAAGAAAVALALLSGIAWPVTRAEEAALRLSLRARPERLETCRTPSAEELAALAEHMRQRTVCEGFTASYRLRVVVDGHLLADIVAQGGGLRRDRPLQLLQDHPIPAGSHRLQVTLDRREVADAGTAGPSTAPPASAPAVTVDTGRYAGRAGREADERDRRRRATLPAALALDTTLTIAPGRVALISFDSETRSLAVRTPAAP